MTLEQRLSYGNGWMMSLPLKSLTKMPACSNFHRFYQEVEYDFF